MPLDAAARDMIIATNSLHREKSTRPSATDTCWATARIAVWGNVLVRKLIFRYAVYFAAVGVVVNY